MAAKTTRAPQLVAVDVAEGLNLRSEPGGDVLRILENDEELRVVKTANKSSVDGWTPVVSSDGLRGWVMSQYIRRLEG